ncbi:MAG: hypothetical protein AAB354_02990 [candidate division KSB1 bacterium]
MTIKATKVGIVIPRKLLGGFEEFEGADVVRGNGKIVVILTVKNVTLGKKAVAERPAAKLTLKEQTLLASAKKKIAAINRNIRKAKGLTEAETKVAAQAGLIDPEQRWWWTEEWQKGERRAQRDIDEGRVSKAYDNVDEALRELKGAL